MGSSVTASRPGQVWHGICSLSGQVEEKKMLSLFSTMSLPAAAVIETSSDVIWLMIALFVLASLGVLRAAWVARKHARVDAAEVEMLQRLARRISASRSDAAHRPLAA